LENNGFAPLPPKMELKFTTWVFTFDFSLSTVDSFAIDSTADTSIDYHLGKE
jgi:hypothetical protein